MEKWIRRFEILIDKLIPYMLVLLLGIIIIEFFFKDFAHNYHFWVELADYVVIIVFIFDLIFKYIHIRNIPRFLKTCWLDIIAVFPFFLVYRVFSEFFVFGETLSKSQKLLHEGLELEKEGVKVLQEAEKLTKSSRSIKLGRFIRPIARIPRFVKAFHFFEHPKIHHALEDKVRFHNLKKKAKKK